MKPQTGRKSAQNYFINCFKKNLGIGRFLAALSYYINARTIEPLIYIKVMCFMFLILNMIVSILIFRISFHEFFLSEAVCKQSAEKQ